MLKRSALVLSVILLFSGLLEAQRDRVVAPVNAARTVALAGHVPSQARPEFDQGPVEGSFPMPSLTLYLKPSNVQQAALQQLLADQQSPSSRNFHQWLTPEQYADRFGVSQNDVAKITAWLESQGFQVQGAARGRGFVRFKGSAQQVQQAFRTQIHRFVENGQSHYANATEPFIPAAFADVVRSIHGLHDFRMKPRAIKATQTAPDFTLGGIHNIVPDDFATIYDVAPLYTAGIDGTGQKLVVVGQTDINLSDIEAFRNRYNLPANDPQKVLPPDETDPGISQDDLPEADLDLEWAGAVARNATILFVYSSNVFNSVQDAIDNNYAPVITMSYGLCEQADQVDLPSFQQLAQQANAEGITWLVASGDAGAADCEQQSPPAAQTGLNVDIPAAVPEVTGMGGSEFIEGTGFYWSSTNTANGASAQKYIPERAWNDTGVDRALSATGGGVSTFFPQPVWQTGPGVPNDGFRHVPDLAISSSADHDGYEVYTGGGLQVYGGTSMAAPTMAGIVTLLNQYLASNGAQKQAGVGNINPMLYRMAQNTPSVFHDVSTGNNIVPCITGTPNCTTGSMGYSAGPGYDSTTGLGSPDANNFVHQWTSAVNVPSGSAIVPSIDQNPVFEQTPDAQGNRWTFTITLNEEAGVATTLTRFTINGQAQNVAQDFASGAITAGGSTSVTLGIKTLTVPATVTFGFAGLDAGGRAWSQQLSVPFNGPQTQLTVGGASNAASGAVVIAPGMLVSVYGTALGDFAQEAHAVPLPFYLAGFEATISNVTNPLPLYYVSPNQVNIQIPYETPLGRQTLTVGNPYANVNFTLNVTEVGPGIFMTNGFVSAPFSSAQRGQTTTLFITGEGNVNPSLPTGTAPDPSTPLSQLPKPRLPVSVTVANQPANIAFVGIPYGLVGVTQINYTVPTNVPLGDQPVVVTVGNSASQAAKLTISQ